MSSSFGNRLKACRDLYGLSQDSLAKKLGVSRTTVTNWETDVAIPDHVKLIALSEIFKVTLDWLLKGIESTFEPPITDFSKIKGIKHKIYPVYPIPVVSRVTAGDSGSIYAEDNIVRYESVPYKPADTSFYLEVEGDSMVRVTGKGINPGDCVKLDTNETVAYDGDVVVVATVDGRQLIKQYIDYDAEKIELRSFNPEYPPFYVRKVDIVSFYRVLEVIPRSWKP